MSGQGKPVTLAECFRAGMTAHREVDVIAWRALAVLLGRVAQAVRDRKDRPAG
jgi:hypothetical protein